MASAIASVTDGLNWVSKNAKLLSETGSLGGRVVTFLGSYRLVAASCAVTIIACLVYAAYINARQIIWKANDSLPVNLVLNGDYANTKNGPSEFKIYTIGRGLVIRRKDGATPKDPDMRGKFFNQMAGVKLKIMAGGVGSSGLRTVNVYPPVSTVSPGRGNYSTTPAHILRFNIEEASPFTIYYWKTPIYHFFFSLQDYFKR